MFAFATLLPLALLCAANVARAVPQPFRRAGTACDGLPDAAYDTLAEFSLAAYYTADGASNDNSTGVPLVLGQAGAVDGASFYVLSTWASFPYNQWPVLSLSLGGLSGDATDFGFVAGENATAGTEPGFLRTSPTPTPAPVYCVVPPASDTDADALPTLAVLGRTDLFSLCPTGDAQPGEVPPQVNVVFDVDDATSSWGYEKAECVPVVLHVVPATATSS